MKNNNPSIKSKEQTLTDIIIDIMPAQIFWKDDNLVYSGCNQAFVTALGLSSKSEVIGKTDFDLPVSKGDSLAYRADDEEILKTGKARLYIEERQKFNDGTEKVLLTSKVPLIDENGITYGILAIYYDISDRKKMEEETIKSKEIAEAASRSKTEFIGNMSHDIRTPLTGIIGISEFLTEELKDADNKNRAGTIHKCGMQLLGLLNSILEVSSLDTNEKEVLQKSFDLYQLIDDLYELEKPAVESRHLALHKSIDSNIPRYLVGDKMKIHRILLNLVGNAIKFTQKGSVSIEVKLLKKDRENLSIQFSVIDTGIGIPEEAQSQVFDRFYKVSPSYEGKFTGNGIGLHIVQKFTSLMGGQIQFNSRLGEGTTFYFILDLPVGEETSNNDEDYSHLLQEERILAEPQQLTELTHQPRKNSGDKPRLLLIEDSIMALNTLKLQLSRFNVLVSEAMDAEIGLELIKTNPPFDLIMTDIGLPGLSGDEMVRVIRAYEKENLLEPQRIVALTGHAADGEFAQKCKAAGIDKIYQKPMDSSTLKTLIEPLLLVRQVKETSVTEATPTGKLGIDLPDSEEELLVINNHPLFDIDQGEKVLGSKEIVYEIMKDFKRSTLGDDLEKIKAAHEKGDWESVERLTHKIKGGACYGTVRLYYALLYMERYLKAGHIKTAEALYRQMLEVIDETTAYLEKIYR